MLRQNWPKVAVIAPVIAIIAVVVTIMVTDFAIGGTNEPQPENLAVLGPGVAAATPILPTPIVPLATATATPAPTVIPGPVAELRDTRRKDDLERIRAALEQYYEKEKEYPSTGGNTQTACTYKEIDALCKLEDLLDPIPEDPLGDAAKNGYWYASDGKSYILIAAMEIPANATPATCPESAARHTKKTNLYCLRVTR